MVEDYEPEHRAEEPAEAPQKEVLLKSSTYDKLKKLALIGLPALGTLYFTVAQIWGLPAAEEVVGTIVAVDTFLGVLLGVSSKQYQGPAVGVLEVSESEEGTKVMQLQFPGDPDTIDRHNRVTFKVKHV